MKKCIGKRACPESAKSVQSFCKQEWEECHCFYTTWSVSQQNWRAVPDELSMELNNADVFELGAS